MCSWMHTKFLLQKSYWLNVCTAFCSMPLITHDGFACLLPHIILLWNNSAPLYSDTYMEDHSDFTIIPGSLQRQDWQDPRLPTCTEWKTLKILADFSNQCCQKDPFDMCNLPESAPAWCPQFQWVTHLGPATSNSLQMYRESEFSSQKRRYFPMCQLIIWYMGISPIMAWVDNHVFIRVLQEHLKEYNQLQLGWHKDITTRGCCHDGGCIWYGVEFWKNLMRTAIFICKTFLTIHLAVKQMLSMHITSVTLTEFWKQMKDLSFSFCMACIRFEWNLSMMQVSVGEKEKTKCLNSISK